MTSGIPAIAQREMRDGDPVYRSESGGERAAGVDSRLDAAKSRDSYFGVSELSMMTIRDDCGPY